MDSRIEEGDDGEYDSGRGVEDHEVHPKSAFINSLRDILSTDQLETIVSLAYPYLQGNGSDLDIQDFGQLAHALDKKGVDVLEFLKHVTEMPGGNLWFADLDINLEQFVQNHKKEIKRSQLKKQLSLSRKDDKFVGRIEELETILCFFEKSSSSITGVYISGRAGMGKTALAEEICHKLREFQTVCVDNLRGKKSVCDLLISILHGLCKMRMNELSNPAKSTVEFQFTENFSHSQESLIDLLQDKLCDLKRGTILFLDNVDDIELHCERDFIQILQELLNINNNQVKLVLTNRRKLPSADIDENLLLQVELKPLTKREAKDLLDTYAKEPYVPLSQSDCETIVEMCKCCPLVIKTIGKQLHQNLITYLMGWSKQPSQEDSHVSCLEVIFHRLSKESQQRLIELSVFEAAFDANMASSVVKDKGAQIGLSDLAQQNMIQRHGVGRCSEDVRYSLHPLVLNCVNRICAKDINKGYSQLKLVAQDRFVEYFFNFITKDRKLEEHGYQTFAYIDDLKVHLWKFFNCFLKDKGFKVRLNKQNKSSVALETLWKFLDFASSKEERHDFMIALGSQLENNTDEVLREFHVKTHRFFHLRNEKDQESANSLMKKLESNLSRVKELSVQEFPLRNMALARYFSAKGLLTMDEAELCQEQDEKSSLQKESLSHFMTALDNLNSYGSKKAVKLNVSIDIEKAKVQNNMGMLHFQMEAFEKSFDHHYEAYKCMRGFVKKNYLPEDMHKDIPIYIFNMGTARQKLYVQYRNQKEPLVARMHLIEAEKHFTKSLDVRKKLGLPDYLTTTMWLLYKADAHRWLKKHTKAINTGKGALRLLKRKLRNPHHILAESLYKLGFAQYSKGRQLQPMDKCGLTDAARIAYEKSAVYYKRLVDVIKHRVLSPEETIAGHIRAVHLEVLKLTEDKDLEKTREFYEEFENKTLVGPAEDPIRIEDICAVSSDEEEAHEEGIQQQRRVKKQDSGFEDAVRISVENVHRGILTKQNSVHENHEKRLRLQKQVSFDESNNEVVKDRNGMTSSQRDSAVGDSISDSFDSMN